MSAPEPFARRWAGLAVLSASLLIVTMDLTILNVALPEMARDLRPTSVELLWIVDIYGLVVAGFLVTASALGDRLGRRNILMAGYTVFGLASLLVLFAESAEAVIAVRALLGIGGAMIMPTTLSMIRTMFSDPRERGTALGIWASVAGAGGALGPIVGGVLLEAFSWHAAFLVNVPLMVVAVVAATPLLPESRSDRPAPIDAVGVVLSVVGMGLVMYAIKELGKHGADLVPVLAALLGIGAVTVFVRRSLRSAHPMIDFGLLRARAFRAGTITAFSAMVGMAALLLLAAQWFQLVDGLSPLEAGFALIPTSVAAIVSSLVAAPLTQRFGPRLPIAGGLGLASAGMLVLFVAPMGFWALMVALVLVGSGTGSLAVASGLIMASTPTEKAGSAATLEETSYELGAALGVAVIGSIAAAAYRVELPADANELARESLAGALEQARSVGADGTRLATEAMDAFTTSLAWAGLAGGIVMALAAVAVWRLAPHEAPTADTHVEAAIADHDAPEITTSAHL